jgi:hypothetical protein
MANDEMLEFVENERKKRTDYSLILNEFSAREKQLREQLDIQQKLIQEQEERLSESRDKLKKEQFLREKSFQRELEERNKLFENRQESLLQRQAQMEQNFHEKLQETEILRNRLENELSSRELALKISEEALEQEKIKYSGESRRQIESKSTNYVNITLADLQSKEDTFHLISKVWSIIGACAISIGIIFIIYATLSGAYLFHNGSGFSWSYFVFITFRGLVVVAMFAALARYAFIYSNSYMHESLKSGERRHAINFGKFYLEVYGADANWAQIQEAFQHWNIGNDSAFSKKPTKEADDTSNDILLTLSKLVENSVNKVKP